MPKNPKRDTLGSLNVFLQTDNFRKPKGGPFDRIRKFSKQKSHSAKKPKGGPFGLPSTFGNTFVV